MAGGSARAGCGAAALILLAAAVACGGNGPSAPSPTGPPPASDLPAGGPCGAVGISSSTAILNGTECPPASSAVVLLNMRDRQGFAAGACTGTVIAPRGILTAAHCLTGDTAVIRVWLGTGPEIVADSFVPHPAYASRGLAVDVGIVTVPQDLGRMPIPLLLSRDARNGEAAVVAGWGRDERTVPATLRAGLTAITGVGPNFLETRYAASVSSVCSGDSGGPILLAQDGRWAIAGVISATSENVCNTGTNYHVNVRNAEVSSFVLERVPTAGQR